MQIGKARLMFEVRLEHALRHLRDASAIAEGHGFLMYASDVDLIILEVRRVLEDSTNGRSRPRLGRSDRP